MRALLPLLFLSQFAAADFLEVRQVVEAGKGAKIYEDPWREGGKLTVSDEIVVSERHVEEAWPVETQGELGEVAIKLNAEGEQRMIAATKDAKTGVTRLAVIIDGELKTAPVLNSAPLGKHFVLHATSMEEAKALAGKLKASMEASKAASFEIRRVVEAGEGKLKVKLPRTGEDPTLEEWTLSDQVLVTRKGLARCWLSQDTGRPTLILELNAEAARQMEEVTAEAESGKPLRLAILVDGKAVSAPLVYSRLGKNLAVDGLNEAEAKQVVEKLKPRE